jgi:catechol 2,3-dioxygenase-like lactoylglutathione lyase family enzyme
MAITGLSHITLICEDLDRMESVLVRVLRAKRIYDSGKDQFSLSEERFYLVGDGNPQDEFDGVWLAVMKGDTLRERSYNHFAFAVDDAELVNAGHAIKALGLDILPSRPRVEGEGKSLYFYDYDNHLFELHSGTLRRRLVRYRTKSQWHAGFLDAKHR